MFKAFNAARTVCGSLRPASICAVSLSAVCLFSIPASAQSMNRLDFERVEIEPVKSGPSDSELELLLPPVTAEKPEAELASEPEAGGPEMENEPETGDVAEVGQESEAVGADPFMEAAEEVGDDPLMEAVSETEAAQPTKPAVEAAPAWPDPENLDIPELAADEAPMEEVAPQPAVAAAKSEQPALRQLSGDMPEGPELVAEEPANEPAKEPESVAFDPLEAAEELDIAPKAQELVEEVPVPRTTSPEMEPAPAAKKVAIKKPKNKTKDIAAAKPEKAEKEVSIFDEWSHNKATAKAIEEKPHPLAAGYPQHFVVVCEAGCAEETAHVVYIERRDARGPVNEKPIKKGTVAGTNAIDCVGGCYDGRHSYLAVAGAGAPTPVNSQEDGWLTAVKPGKAADGKKSAKQGRWYDRIE